MSEWREVELGELIEVHDHRRVPISRIIREHRQGSLGLAAVGVVLAVV